MMSQALLQISPQVVPNHLMTDTPLRQT